MQKIIDLKQSDYLVHDQGPTKVIRPKSRISTNNSLVMNQTPKTLTNRKQLMLQLQPQPLQYNPLTHGCMKIKTVQSVTHRHTQSEIDLNVQKERAEKELQFRQYLKDTECKHLNSISSRGEAKITRKSFDQQKQHRIILQSGPFLIQKEKIIPDANTSPMSRNESGSIKYFTCNPSSNFNSQISKWYNKLSPRSNRGSYHRGLRMTLSNSRIVKGTPFPSP